MSRAVAAPAPVRRAARGGARRLTRRQRIVFTIVNLALFFVAWEMAPDVLDVPPLFLPKFTDVLGQIPLMHQEGILIENVWVSLRVYLIGMALSIGSSIPLGLLLGGFKFLDRIVSPYLWVIYTTPMIVLMPLILLWVGINNTARILLVAISSIPAIVVVVMEGVKTVDNSLLLAARSFGADRRRLFTHVVFPSTIPFIGTGVKMGVSRGLIGLFVGELLTATTGLGYVITLAAKVFNTARMYALLLMFVVFCMAMVGGSQYLERRLSRWRSMPNV